LQYNREKAAIERRTDRGRDVRRPIFGLFLIISK
jgi:hypothetical protein